jgi:hypothetical protein
MEGIPFSKLHDGCCYESQIVMEDRQQQPKEIQHHLEQKDEQQQQQQPHSQPGQQQHKEQYQQQQPHQGQRRVTFQTDDKLETIYILDNDDIDDDDLNSSESSLSVFSLQMELYGNASSTNSNNDSSRSFEFADEGDGDSDSDCDSTDDCIGHYISSIDDGNDDDDLLNCINILRHKEEEEEDTNNDVFDFPLLSTIDAEIITTGAVDDREDESIHSVTNDSTDEGGYDLVVDDDDIDQVVVEDDDEGRFELVTTQFVDPRIDCNSMETEPNTVSATTTTTTTTESLSNPSACTRKRRYNFSVTSSRLRDELDDVSHRRLPNRRFFSF